MNKIWSMQNWIQYLSNMVQSKEKNKNKNRIFIFFFFILQSLSLTKFDIHCYYHYHQNPLLERRISVKLFAVLYLARLFYRHGISAEYREMGIFCAELFHCRGISGQGDDRTPRRGKYSVEFSRRISLLERKSEFARAREKLWTREGDGGYGGGEPQCSLETKERKVCKETTELFFHGESTTSRHTSATKCHT